MRVFCDGGRIRGIPVTISGSSYIPPLPNELDVKDRIRKMVQEEANPLILRSNYVFTA